MDPFSFTTAGRRWVAHRWLWELGVFHLYRLGGYRAAVLLSALIVTFAYAVLYRLMRHLGANEIVAAALVLWAAFLPCWRDGRWRVSSSLAPPHPPDCRG